MAAILTSEEAEEDASTASPFAERSALTPLQTGRASQSGSSSPSKVEESKTRAVHFDAEDGDNSDSDSAMLESPVSDRDHAEPQVKATVMEVATAVAHVEADVPQDDVEMPSVEGNVAQVDEVMPVVEADEPRAEAIEPSGTEETNTATEIEPPQAEATEPEK